MVANGIWGAMNLRNQLQQDPWGPGASSGVRKDTQEVREWSSGTREVMVSSMEANFDRRGKCPQREVVAKKTLGQ